MVQTKPEPAAAATPPNRPRGTCRRESMQVAVLSTCLTACVLLKTINLVTSVMHRLLQATKPCLCLTPNRKPNARPCAAVKWGGDGREWKMACSRILLLWNARRCKRQAANNCISARTSIRHCNWLSLRLVLLTVRLKGRMPWKKQACL